MASPPPRPETSRWTPLTVKVAVRRGARLARRVARRGRRVLRKMRRRWRRSLPLRVVATTLLISMTVVAVLGFFLMQQVAAGLLEAKRTAALAEANADRAAALALISAKPGAEQHVLLDSLAMTLAERAGPTARYEVVIFTSPGDLDAGRATRSISHRSVPDHLRRQVERSTEPSKQFYAYTQLHYEHGPSVPGLAVGTKVSRYELYHLFSLVQEAGTLSLMRRTLITVGGVLCLLLAAIAALVTHQVVAPVRLAAKAAERLAAGQLTERMPVRGQDDLAKLATSFNKMAGKLAEKIRELEELSQVQRQFVSDVSHELRTPLATIRMATDVLYERREEFDPAGARSVELLQTQLERFEELLVDLLEISRYDAGAATLEAESGDVRDIVLNTVGDVETLAERKATRLLLRLPPEACMAEVDSRRVARILRNLLVNAIEHGEGKDVVVTVATDRDAVAITVRDHGMGLRPGEEELVFDRFWRADPARARSSGGSGLGLAIAREDALLHGGWLQAWGGQPGEGSQFRLTVPRVARAELRGSPLPLVPPEIELERVWMEYVGADRGDADG